MNDMKAPLDLRDSAGLRPTRPSDINASQMDGSAQSVGRRNRAVRLMFVAPLGVAALSMLAGCSLFVMGGRMLMGDTKSKSQFKQATKTDLVKTHKKVLVLCSAADSIRTG